MLYNVDNLLFTSSPMWRKTLSKFVAEVKFIILTSPRPKRVDRIEEDLMKQGSVLADFISTDARRIVMVISGDLSHMYQYDCTEDWYTPSISSNLYVSTNYSLNFFHDFTCVPVREN